MTTRNFKNASRRPYIERRRLDAKLDKIQEGDREKHIKRKKQAAKLSKWLAAHLGHGAAPMVSAAIARLKAGIAMTPQQAGTVGQLPVDG